MLVTLVCSVIEFQTVILLLQQIDNNESYPRKKLRMLLTDCVNINLPNSRSGCKLLDNMHEERSPDLSFQYESVKLHGNTRIVCIQVEHVTMVFASIANKGRTLVRGVTHHDSLKFILSCTNDAFSRNVCIVLIFHRLQRHRSTNR